MSSLRRLVAAIRRRLSGPALPRRARLLGLTGLLSDAPRDLVDAAWPSGTAGRDAMGRWMRWFEGGALGQGPSVAQVLALALVHPRAGAVPPSVFRLMREALEQRCRDELLRRIGSLGSEGSAEAPRSSGVRDEPPWSLEGSAAGRRVFVVGAGPGLARLTEAQRERLQGEVVIGVNRTFLAVPVTHFISSYPWEVALARDAEVPVRLHLTNDWSPEPVLPGSQRLRRVTYTKLIDLPAELGHPVPTLYTRRNIVLAASHLALIMGATEIVYLGVEQDDPLHFWQVDHRWTDWLRGRIETYRDERDPDTFRGYDMDTMVPRLLEALDLDAASVEDQPFHEDHQAVFAAYIERLEARGLGVRTLTPGSVVERAGARAMAWSELDRG